jgi:hypothetical protein
MLNSNNRSVIDMEFKEIISKPAAVFHKHVNMPRNAISKPIELSTIRSFKVNLTLSFKMNKLMKRIAEM